jgi:hypothetical protein
MQTRLKIALAAAGFALATIPGFAAEMPTDGSKNFSPPTDAPSYFTNETVPESARVDRAASFDTEDAGIGATTPDVGPAVSVGTDATQYDRHASTYQSLPGIELFRPASESDLERVAFAVDGAESSHGTDLRMWRPELNGPQGPMQVSAAAATDLGGGNRFDMVENRQLGRGYLALMHRRYGNWPDAITAYNWGPGNMNAWIASGRPIAGFPFEVGRYRDRVLRDAGFDDTSRNPVFYDTRKFPEVASPSARQYTTVVTSIRPDANQAAAGPSPSSAQVGPTLAGQVQSPRRFDTLRQMRSGASVALLVGVTLIQCYATRTTDGCEPMSVHARLAECRALASEYRKFDTRALRVTGLPVVVSYDCVAVE